MAQLNDIVDFITDLLDFSRFHEVDRALNGLQVEGNPTVEKIGAAVDCGLCIVERAAHLGAQLLLVHHGIFWGRPLPVIGPHYRWLRAMFETDLSLVAVHLPLDAHEELGNAFSVARFIGLSEIVPCAEYHGCRIGALGENRAAVSLEGMSEALTALPGAREAPLALPFGPPIPKRVAVVTGSGADFLRSAKADDFDTLITGEARQFAYHYAREHGLNVIFAGHYATETLGVQNLAEAVSRQFGVEWFFVDHPTGI